MKGADVLMARGGLGSWELSLCLFKSFSVGWVERDYAESYGSCRPRSKPSGEEGLADPRQSHIL